jgi:hypothetical protein
MRRKAIKRAIIGLAACCGLILGTWILNNRIRIVREERERYFIAVHFVAMESVGAPDDKAPKTIEELMEMYAGGGAESSLLKPFRNGLSYRRTHGGFEIAEPRQEFVSLFRRDRLIASDREWSHWESSGMQVWKFPGQTIPPNYLNSNSEPGVGGNRR